MSKTTRSKKQDNKLQDNAPTQSKNISAKWRSHLKIIQSAFPSPWKEEGDDQIFENTFLQAVHELDTMKHPRMFQEQKAWQGYLGDPALPDYSTCKDVKLNEHMTPLPEVITELVNFFNGMPNWNHPQTMCNVVPPPNTASIIGSTLCQVFSPNILEGEYSWNIAKTEIESGAMLAQLIGWDPHKSGGIYTFGGTGCYLYGTKLALTTVLGKETRFKGIREEGQILVSRAGHYVKQNCSDWTGLGMNNVREIPVDEHNRMSIPDLKRVMKECQQEGKPVVMIVCTMGTTDAFAIDPIAEVRKIIDQYKNAKEYPKPFLYADAVIGWSWLAFRSYDFKKNPLQFSKKALKILEHNYQQIKPLHFADAIGIDFHKTGWAPYNSSFFVVKDYDTFCDLLSRPLPGYLQDRTSYNPFKFTLETSRTGAYAMAGWATLRLFGHEGYQVMLGRIIEVGIFFRELLQKDKNLVCVNPDNHGFVTLFRVYPKHVDAEQQYEKELNDPQYQNELRAYNLLQQRIANKLFALLRDPKQKVPGWENPPYTSFTSGYRTPEYAPDEKDSRYFVYALKAFPMSPNSNELSMQIVRNYVLKARDMVIDELIQEHQKKKKTVRTPKKTKPQSLPRTTENWYGDNEDIPLKYLIPSDHVSLEETIKNNPFCAHLTDDQLQLLVQNCTTESVDAGRVICSEGDRADKVYLILSGKVKVYKEDTRGKETELATIEKGHMFGEMALFDKGFRSASVKTIEPCKFMVFNGEKFLELLLG
ncbi:MAG: cyclic nucleotide-binding domain-containing protein [Methanobacteriota archaeon]